MTFSHLQNYHLAPPSQLVQTRPFSAVSHLVSPQSLFPPRPTMTPITRYTDRFTLSPPAQLRSNPSPGLASPNLFAFDGPLNQKQQIAVRSAYQEWQSGVRENLGTNRGTRIDQYARNSHFGPGHAWCGFFTAFTYSQGGFKHASSLASYQKARDFFVYRSYTNHSKNTNQELDQLRAQHQQQGSQRQFFMLQESPEKTYFRNYGSLFSHYNIEANTFNYQTLPIRPGDTVLYHHGHVGLVVSYDRRTGKLVTIEGNTTGQGPDGKTWSNAVVKKEYDLTKASVREKFSGFGRPAAGDFQ